MLRNAYNLIIHFRGRVVTLRKKDGSIEESIKIAESNYFRNLRTFEESSYEGFEFVITKTSLDAISFGTPKKGDRIVDDLGGTNTISYVKPDIVFGEILGFRVRTS